MEEILNGTSTEQLKLISGTDKVLDEVKALHRHPGEKGRELRRTSLDMELSRDEEESEDEEENGARAMMEREGAQVPQ